MTTYDRKIRKQSGEHNHITKQYLRRKDEKGPQKHYIYLFLYEIISLIRPFGAPSSELSDYAEDKATFCNNFPIYKLLQCWKYRKSTSLINASTFLFLVKNNQNHHKTMKRWESFLCYHQVSSIGTPHEEKLQL